MDEQIKPLDNQNKLIALLTENNQLLNKLYNLELGKVHDQKRKELLHFIAQVIPFLVLALLIWFVYSTIMGYINALTNNVDLLKTSVINFFESMKNLIPDFSGAGEKLNSLWESAKNAF